MKSKAIAVLALLVLSLFLFAGCAESITYVFYVDKLGSLHYDYIVKYDATAADAADFEERAVAVMNKIVEDEGLKKQSKIETSTGKIVLSITFSDYTERNIASGQTGKEKSIPLEQEKAGVFRYYDSVINPYASVFSMVRSAIGDEVYDWPDPDEMYYVFGTIYSTDRTNADFVEKTDGIYYHSWKIESGTPIQVIVRRYTIDWFLVFGAGISLFVLSLVVLFVIIYITDKRKKQIFSVRVPEEGAGAIPVNEETERTDDPFDFGKGD